MFKFLIMALVTVELVLLSAFLHPANAAVQEPELYAWDYASVRTDKLVCKQVIVSPKNRLMPDSSDMQPVTIRSKITSDRYCAGSPKPNI